MNRFTRTPRGDVRGVFCVRHSREGGNLKRKRQDSRLRGNDEIYVRRIQLTEYKKTWYCEFGKKTTLRGFYETNYRYFG